MEGYCEKFFLVILNLLILTGAMIGCSNQDQQSFEQKHSFEKLSDAEFIINDEIFDQSVEEIIELTYPDGELNTEMFVREIENTSNYSLNEIELPNTFKYPITAMKGEEFVVILDETEFEKKHDVYFWNYLNDEAELLNLKTNEDFLIVEIALGSEHIYWIESDQNFIDKNPAWKINSYNITTKEINEVDSSESYKRISLIPRLNVSNNTLTYTVGEEDAEEYNHYIIMYEAQKKQKKSIFNIENVINPYLKPYINSNVIAFPEYFKDGWFLLIYDIEKEIMSKEPLIFLTDGEYPRNFHMIDNHIIYGSSQNILYALNINTGKQDIVSDRFSSGEIVGDRFYYIELGQLWRYNITTNSKEELYNSKEYWISGFEVNNQILSTVADQNSEGNIFYYLEFDVSN